MNISVNKRKAWLICLLAGAVLPLAFAPWTIYPLSFIAPAILLYQWQKSTPRQAFIQGGLFGLGFYGVGVSWVYISIHNYGNASILVASFITLAMIMVLSLGPATQGYVLMRLFGKRKLPWLCLAAFPATWVIWEWLRSLPLNGFPWLYLGYAQIATPLRGYAPLLGVYGVSLAVAILCGSFMLISSRQTPRTKMISVALVLVIIGGGWLLTGKRWTKPAAAPLTVTLVQANVSQSIKWQPGQFENIVNTYETMSAPFWGKSQLVVWPEAALPAFPAQIPNILARIDKTAAHQNSTLLLGILLGDPIQKQPYYNGIMLLGADHGEYRKRHLVPFGEYTPLISVFGFLINYWQIPMSDFSAGPAYQSALTAAGVKIAPFICYEIAYPLTVLKYSRNSEMIVNISDDSWFGKSMASAQQAEIARLRALETGRFILLSGNTGITGIINPLGDFDAAIPAHQKLTLSATATPMHGQTPLMRFNYWPILSLILALLILTTIA